MTQLKQKYTIGIESLINAVRAGDLKHVKSLIEVGTQQTKVFKAEVVIDESKKGTRETYTGTIYDTPLSVALKQLQFTRL